MAAMALSMALHSGRVTASEKILKRLRMAQLARTGSIAWDGRSLPQTMQSKAGVPHPESNLLDLMVEDPIDP